MTQTWRTLPLGARDFSITRPINPPGSLTPADLFPIVVRLDDDTGFDEHTITDESCVVVGTPTNTVTSPKIVDSLNGQIAQVVSTTTFHVLDANKCAVVQWRDGYAGWRKADGTGGFHMSSQQYGIGDNPATSAGLLVVDSKDDWPAPHKLVHVL